jgi:hypothetical protein
MIRFIGGQCGERGSARRFTLVRAPHWAAAAGCQGKGDIGAYELVKCQGVIVNRVGTAKKDKLKGGPGEDKLDGGPARTRRFSS